VSASSPACAATTARERLLLRIEYALAVRGGRRLRLNDVDRISGPAFAIAIMASMIAIAEPAWLENFSEPR